MDQNRFLEQFMGSDQTGFGKGAVVGGLLGLLVGNKKARKMAGGVVGYGGAAVAAALAYKAYQNWQQGQQPKTAPLVTPADLHNVDARFMPPPPSSAAGQNFALTLVTAMIYAAKADGHIDAQEQTAIFEQVEKLGLDAASKAQVFDALRSPVNLDKIVAGVEGVEQASEVYLVSRLAVNVDHPAERSYLQVLAHRLNLPTELVAHLDHQVVEA